MADNSAACEIGVFDPSISVFVSANAGTGKTSLLVNRVLSLLLQGTPPSRILCLTFTNAAAAEMSNRILKELGAWVMMEEKPLCERLFKLMGKMPGRTIIVRARALFALVLEAPEGIRMETIHGFCHSLLTRFPIEAGINPHFSVMETATEQEMLKEAQIRLFNRARDEDKELQSSIHALAHALNETSLNKLLAEIVKNKRKFYTLFSQPGGMDAAIGKLWEHLQLAKDCSLEALIAEYFPYDKATLAQFRQIAGILSQGADTDRKTAQGLALWFEDADARIARASDYVSVFLTQKGERRMRLFTAGALNDQALMDLLLAEQERCLRFNEALLSLDVAICSSHVLHVAEALLSIYDALKRAYARMDYDDLILHSCALLERDGISPWILFKLDGGIDHILVDEAQDTSPEQWMIINALTQEFFAGEGRQAMRSLFIVGDEKQSIYSFQGADVRALGRMQNYFRQRIQDAAAPARYVQLTRSFRSAPEILAAVDAIFAQPNARNGLMFSDDTLSHMPTRLAHPGLVELWPLIPPAEEGVLSSSLQLARMLAETIRSWLDKGLMLEAKGRAVEAGDIMILVRRRSAFVDQLTRALKRRNVPVAGLDRMMLGDNLAVQDLIALGQILLLPSDDLTLASLLKSPIFNVNEEALFVLSWQRGGKSLWDRLSESTEKSCAEAYALLSDLRAQTDFKSPFELYSTLLDTHGARRRFLGRMGEEYQDAIDEFLAQALLYERSHTPSMQGFLHWLANSRSEIKRDLEQAENRVRIMTVHGAKGLQAPIVILPDTIEPPKPKDTLLWYGDKVPLPLWPQSSRRDNGLCRRLRAQQRQDRLAEYRRLLYVALTRAEDRLYICGAANRRDKISEDSWYHLVKAGITPLAEPFNMPLGNGLRIGPAPSTIVKPVAKKSAASKEPFPFLKAAPPKEPQPPRPLSPSQLPGADPAAASPLTAEISYGRGLLIHRLLQFLPDITVEKQMDAAENLAAGFRRSMSDDDINTCIKETLAIIHHPAFGFLFSGESMAEVPIAGTVTVAKKPVSIAGQIDRLCVNKEGVWIVDFKTNRLPPEDVADTPKAYLRQLFLYRRLVEEIYPAKPVRCALLWTATSTLEIIDEALLDERSLSSYI